MFEGRGWLDVSYCIPHISAQWRPSSWSAYDVTITLVIYSLAVFFDDFFDEDTFVFLLFLLINQNEKSSKHLSFKI